MKRIGARLALLLLALAGATGRGNAHPSLGGTTGLFNVPTADVISDGTAALGYNIMDRKWSYEGRGTLDNRIWFLTLGFLPRLEVSVRATVLPGESLLEDVPVDAVDRMASARFQALTEGRFVPEVSLGIDDVKGTRRFHSLYGVASKTVAPPKFPLRAQFSAGYGLRSIDAARYLLDGGFGGVDLRFLPWFSGIAEYDSEKWNAGFRLSAPFGVDLRLAFLNMETASGGISFQHRL